MSPDSVAEQAFRSVAVFGPGLLGGSIAMAVHERLPQTELRLWARREQPLAFARERGLTEKLYTDPLEAARGAELIILCTPIGVFEDLCHRILPAIGHEALVTDVGSVKAYVHRTTGDFLRERRRLFIGSHPMAGAETTGIESASAELLKGATVALTNPNGVAAEQVGRLAAFWQALGCSTYLMDPRNHDRAVARISHMPHIMAALAARNAAQGDVPVADLQRLASSGFRDTTRVCSGPAPMWADILWENDVAIREVLQDCVEDLHALINLLEDQDRDGVRRWLETARASREQIRRKNI